MENCAFCFQVDQKQPAHPERRSSEGLCSSASILLTWCAPSALLSMQRSIFWVLIVERRKTFWNLAHRACWNNIQHRWRKTEKGSQGDTSPRACHSQEENDISVPEHPWPKHAHLWLKWSSARWVGCSKVRCRQLPGCVQALALCVRMVPCWQCRMWLQHTPEHVPWGGGGLCNSVLQSIDAECEASCGVVWRRWCSMGQQRFWS